MLILEFINCFLIYGIYDELIYIVLKLYCLVLVINLLILVFVVFVFKNVWLIILL